MTKKTIMGKLRIVSKNGVMFHDRQEAGCRLVYELMEFRNKHAVVLGIPRGGVILAREIARELDAEMDIVISRKLRTPGQSELAMGSIAEDGKVFLNEAIIRDLNVDRTLIEREVAVQKEEIARRSSLIRKIVARIQLKGRIVIITDDGVATGATTQAAIWAVTQEQPQYVIAAIPVGSEETVKRLSQDVDEMVCLGTPPFFSAVGQFYRNFEQIEDEDMIKLLEAEQKSRASIYNPQQR